MKYSFGKFIALLLIISMLAACGTSEGDADASSSDSEGKKVLKMATSADFPPFESRDKDGNFEGFDIDLAHLIADKLGYELEIEDMKFDGLIGALQSSRVDMVMAGMSTTDKRKKNVDFSTEYNHSGEMFINQKDSEINGLDDLEGKTVGVQLGTIQEEGAEKLSKEYGFTVKKVDNSSILIQELKSNRVDVAYMDKTVAVGYIEEQGFAGFDDPTTSSPGMGIAFPKGSDLRDDVTKVLKELEKNGKLQELKDKWLSE
ncbi:ABC transporter substrate-binding protein [Virgibacillus litoralis]|uniref:Polar amino acid transport system substrate-binding protein n=1 Tax=Virgibacillus litoralis TaxID=578221 RepID=A0ABS4HD05_9BACI|nr:ABC transporter substrate-binding protein [Virgibacillus litoralis]MBP1948494.1 polar amino acid transport system substrate-binding protein [Virgibacillus litoralis]